MALLITSFLILTNMSASVVEFDGSAVFTAMHAWFYACRLLVGGALLQFAWVIKKFSGVPKKAKVARSDQTKKEDKLCRYDYYAFIVFNALFIVFCVVYGVICLSH